MSNFKHFGKNRLLFAEDSFYSSNRRAKSERDYRSNIEIKHADSQTGKTCWWPLYQIYFIPGENIWGLWRPPCGHDDWEVPKFYAEFKQALYRARILYLDEHFDEGEYRIADSCELKYFKKVGYMEWETVHVPTSFCELPNVK